jgi:plastocyanin
MGKLRLPHQLTRYAKPRYPIALAVAGLGGGIGILADVGGLGSAIASRVNAAEAREVEIDNFKFAPGVLTVPVGTTVTWVNHDEEVHTVTAGDQPQSFKSPGLDTDDKFSFTFDTPGTYGYFCSIHSYMKGKIVAR